MAIAGGERQSFWYHCCSTIAWGGLPVSDLSSVLQAAAFAAEKHRKLKRKDNETPYINHPIWVAEMLARVAGVTDPDVLCAALLHDTIEDTDTTADELRQKFGERVLSLVLECTDDKNLPKEERKRQQVEHAPDKSAQAKLIKIADKISNMTDVTDNAAPEWDLERKVGYINWSDAVFQGLKGGNQALDALFVETRDRALRTLKG
jgi:guanosine-3',5'-bis(diphosphate) 3'-pyrophosphohydrolase